MYENGHNLSMGNPGLARNHRLLINSRRWVGTGDDDSRPHRPDFETITRDPRCEH